MQNWQPNFDKQNLTTATNAKTLVLYWQKRLEMECPEQSFPSRESITNWLLVNDLHRFEESPQQLESTKQAMKDRYRILRQRYLGVSREQAYRNFITRFGAVVTSHQKIQAWVAKNRDRQRLILDVLEEVIQDLLQNNNYIQQQMAYIAECTTDNMLRNALLFTTLEEYCLHSGGKQPLLVYCVKYLLQHNRSEVNTHINCAQLQR